jgi:hypothetical protein
MYCKSCEYPLWNIAPPRDGGPRHCPECGVPFKPSDFRFAANAVRFCCPTCNLAYYGTTADGHLEPATFTCVQCATICDMDQMVLLPGFGVPEQVTRGGTINWQDPTRRRGPLRFISTWIATCSMVAFTPYRFGELLASVPKFGIAITFYLITAILGWTFGSGWIFLVGRGGPLIFTAGVPAYDIIESIMRFLLFIIGGPAVTLLVFALSALSTKHFTHRLGAKQVTWPMAMECHLYGIAGLWLMAVPCVGFLLSVLAVPYAICVTGAMLAGRSGLSVARGVLAVAGLPLLVLVVTVATLIVMGLLFP